MARGAAVPRADVAMRRAQAIELRNAGLPWSQIATRLGYKSPGAACQDVSRAIQAIQNGPARQMALEELNRLDAMLASLWPGIRKGSARSVEVALKLMEQRAKYRRVYGVIDDDDPASATKSMLTDLAKALESAAAALPDDRSTAGSPPAVAA